MISGSKGRLDPQFIAILIIVCTPPNIVMVIKCRSLGWGVHIVSMEGGMSAFKILTVKPTGKRALSRPRRRLQGNIRIM